MAEKKLTSQQERFCQEYAVSLNATQAAINARYSKKTAAQQGCRLLKDVNILARVRAIQKERFEQLAITHESVLLDLLEIRDRCMQAKPVMIWDSTEKTYVESGEYTFDSTGAIKAVTKIGEHLGMFKKRVEHSIPDDAPPTGVILIPAVQELPVPEELLTESETIE